jgi:hypothetical protein
VSEGRGHRFVRRNGIQACQKEWNTSVSTGSEYICVRKRRRVCQEERNSGVSGVRKYRCDRNKEIQVGQEEGNTDVL